MPGIESLVLWRWFTAMPAQETGPVSAKEEEQPALSGFFLAVIGRGRETVDRWETRCGARRMRESGWHAQDRGVVDSAV